MNRKVNRLPKGYSEDPLVDDTIYGSRIMGQSRFIFVAPHGAGDDKRTVPIAYALTKKLNASGVFNTVYIKPTNSKALENPDKVCDFNKLVWHKQKNRHLWKNRHPAMQTFFKDIKKMCKDIKNKINYPAVVIYIHGFKSEIGLDIGFGVSVDKNDKEIIGSGVTTAPLESMIVIKNTLVKDIKNTYNLPITLGKYFSGRSRQSAIQFHRSKLPKDFSLQIEINQSLRKDKKSRNDTINAIAKALTIAFPSPNL